VSQIWRRAPTAPVTRQVTAAETLFVGVRAQRRRSLSRCWLPTPQASGEVQTCPRRSSRQMLCCQHRRRGTRSARATTSREARILSADEAETRVRVLPRPPVPRSAVALVEPTVINPPSFALPGSACLDVEKGNRVGEPKLGSTVPPCLTHRSSWGRHGASPSARQSRLDVLAGQRPLVWRRRRSVPPVSPSAPLPQPTRARAGA
jgi:hypothetical protein